jgi:general secretion pathway protein D
MRSRISFPGFLLAALAASVLLAACAADPVTDARKHFDEGRGEEALAVLEKAYKENPGNLAARSDYFRLRELLAAQWLSQAETLRLAGQFELAEALYQRVLKQDAANPRARAGLTQVEADLRHRAIVAAAEKLAKAEKYLEAQNVLRPVLAENPQQREAQRLQRQIDEKLVKPAIASVQLKTSTAKPISLELRDVPLRSAFDILSRASGINFVFDKDVRADLRASIVVKDATIEDAIRMILISNQLEQKILSENTVFIFPNTPQKMREHQELVVKSFYLANADVKQTANMIRTLVKTRDIFIDEKINLLVIKDTPNAVRLAERLIAAQDLAEPEVMLEVEVLEVASNRVRELGLRFPDSVAWSLEGAAKTPGTVTLPEWLNRGSGLVQLTSTNPLFLFTLRQTDGSTSVLANPRIRVKNKEKAKIHIGDRVPVITTTAASAGTFVSESVTYLDVGLKLEVEPLIYLDDEVGIKVGLEVSNIVKEVRSTSSTTSGSLAYQIGTRNATTTLRLRDGETQILAGLISNDDRRTASRVPGVGDLPTVGRLFSATKDETTKTEIVLLITPRLVRTLTRPDVRSIEFAAGTEAATGAPAIGVGIAPFAPTAQPFTPPRPATPPTPPVAFPPAPQPPPPTTAPGVEMVPFGGVQPEPQQQR